MLKITAIFMDRIDVQEKMSELGVHPNSYAYRIEAVKPRHKGLGKYMMVVRDWDDCVLNTTIQDLEWLEYADPSTEITIIN